MKDKKNIKFKILIPFQVILFVTLLLVNFFMWTNSEILNNYIAYPNIIINYNDVNKNYDGNYYSYNYNSKDQIDEKIEDLAEEAEKEGAVLLKNNDALPLNASSKNPITINALGWSFYYPVNDGGGSGSIGTSQLISPEQCLKEVGININQKLKDNYIQWTEEHYKLWGQTKPTRPKIFTYDSSHWDIPELSYSDCSSILNKSKASSNNIQLVWIGRNGSELGDAPLKMDETGLVSFNKDSTKHYLELSNEEINLIEKAKELRGSHGKVIVILNTHSPMELASLQYDDKIDAICWVGAPGKTGYYAIGKILTGIYNPSGRLADTYAVDLMKNPVMKNFSDLDVNTNNEPLTHYSTSIAYGEGKTREVYYVDYEESIYLGYRFYETAVEQNYYSTKNLPNKIDDPYYNLDNGVVYPFGYGLSYTSFSQEIISSNYDNGEFVFEIKIINTGNVPGKDVVELYVETPYTSKIEKAKVVLCEFNKTRLLKPNEQQIIELRVKAEDIASYDDEINKCYVLEKGTYKFYLSVVNEINFGSHSWYYADEKSSVSFDDAIKEDIIYKEDYSGPRESEKYSHDESGEYFITAENQFDEFLIGNNLNTQNGYETLSRKSFNDSFPTSPTKQDKIMSDELKNILNNSLYDNYELVSKHNNANDIMPEINVNNNLQLIDLRGVNYNDDLWNSYVEQFTIEEMVNLVGDGAYKTNDVIRLGKPRTNDNDGPQVIKARAIDYRDFSAHLVPVTTEVVLASTWNLELLYEIGEAFGEEALHYGVNGWYAPAINIHRSPFGGRNFEYFSEDPFLTGKIAMAEVCGASSKGLITYIKHFAMNDQETWCREINAGKHKADDVVLLTWANEQTMREIYLRPFEIVVKNVKTTLKYLSQDGEKKEIKDFKGALGIMSSFNFIGNTWAGGNSALLNDILRGEWGFEGTIITDSAGEDYMYTDQALRAGGDLILHVGLKEIKDTQSPTAIKELQRAVKNICYTTAHSNVMNKIVPGCTIDYSLSSWQIALILGDAIGISIIIICGIFIYLDIIKNKKDSL